MTTHEDTKKIVAGSAMGRFDSILYQVTNLLDSHSFLFTNEQIKKLSAAADSVTEVAGELRDTLGGIK